MNFAKRRPTVTVQVGDVRIGSAHPVVVQCMTNTDTADAKATAAQVASLAQAGAQIVRVTVNNDEAAGAALEIRQRLVDLGVNVPPEKFIAAVREHSAQIVGFSALLTTTMPSMKLTIEAFQAAGLRDKVKILIGGAPVTQRFANEIGADGYGENAPAAVALARKCVGVTAD